ncbi:hypothetical protein QJQ45_016252 [Haematococcus lacustris]|nr:hypothetical protein QJQ45_016252 [Haematococcus lacustris]
MVVVTAFQVFTLTSLKQQDWYTAFDPSSHPPLDIAVSERQAATGALFITGCWQLIIMALVFNVGRPFRREIWTNSWLMASLLGLVAFNLYVTWAPGDPFRRRVPAVIDLPIHYRRVLAFIAISTLCIAYATDMVCTCLYQYCKKEWSRTRAGSRPKAERRAEGAALGIGPAHTAAPPPVARQQLELPMQHLLPAAGHAPRSDAYRALPLLYGLTAGRAEGEEQQKGVAPGGCCRGPWHELWSVPPGPL